MMEDIKLNRDVKSPVCKGQRLTIRLQGLDPGLTQPLHTFGVDFGGLVACYKGSLEPEHRSREVPHARADFYKTEALGVLKGGRKKLAEPRDDVGVIEPPRQLGSPRDVLIVHTHQSIVHEDGGDFHGIPVAAKAPTPRIFLIFGASKINIRKMLKKWMSSRLVQCALFCGGVNALITLFHAVSLRRAGLHVGGPFTLDGYTLFSMANELKRSGSSLVFNNPFVHTGAEPGLINFYASILRWFEPLYSKDLFVFDLAWNSLFAALGAYFYLKVLSHAPKTGQADAKPYWKWVHVVFFSLASGTAYIVERFYPDAIRPAMMGSLWGLSPAFNATLTHEVFYFALFFISVWLFLNGSLRALAASLLFTALIHPFTAGLLTGVLVISSCLELASHSPRPRALVRQRLALALGAVGFLYLYWIAFLPRFSDEARYYYQVYKTMFLVLPPGALALFLLPVGALLAAYAVSARRELPRLLVTDPVLILMISGFLVSFLLSISDLFTSLFLQPAHWSHAYPFVFLLGAALRIARAARLTPTLRVVTILVLAVGIADTALGMRFLAKFNRVYGRPPYRLTSSEKEVLHHLNSRQGSGWVTMLYDCKTKRLGGDFEYAITALTHHRTWLAHWVFFQDKGVAVDKDAWVYLCENESSELKQRREAVLGQSRFIVVESSAIKRLPERGFRSVMSATDLTLLERVLPPS